MQNTYLELILFAAVTGIVVTSTISLIIYVMYKYKKNHVKYLLDMEHQKAEYEKTILNVKLEIQEQTAHYIAREIHDSIGHSLTLAKLQLNTLVDLPNDADSNKIRMAVDLLGHSIQQLSDISKNLNAEALLQQGLLPGLDEEINRLRSLNHFELQYEVNGFTSYMEPQREIVLYRIVQEGFQNILKHANATRAQLVLHFHPDFVHVSLTDNGQGFDPSAPVKSRSTGLVNMENRIQFLNGDFQIHSAPNHGTRIQFTIPYQANVKLQNDQDRISR